MKKDFTANAASVFISSPTKDTDSAVDSPATSNADNPVDAYSKKDKRLNLLIPSGVYNDLKKIAFIQQTSVNNLITVTMKQLIKQNQKEIEHYNTFMKEMEK